MSVASSMCKRPNNSMRAALLLRRLRQDVSGQFQPPSQFSAFNLKRGIPNSLRSGFILVSAYRQTVSLR